MTTRNRELASIIDASGNITASGNLTVSGTTTAVSSTNTTVSDPLIELNSGASSNSNDLGFVFERGSTGNNAALIWDESNDTFALGTTTATGSSTGNMSISAAGITLSTINGLTYPTSDGSANQVLKTDGSGALSFTNPTVTSIAVENESGNGSTTAFTLSADPGTENNTQVYIDGVYQFKNTYTVSGTTLTFDTAPANGASIEIIAITAGSLNNPADDTVSTAKIQNNAVTADKIVANAVGISELNVSDGSNGQVLTTNGSGTLSFTSKTALLTGIDDQSSSNDDQITITDTTVVINEDSDDVDFRVEGNGEANLLFVNAGDDKVGIGEASPLGQLHVKTGESSTGTPNASANILVLEGSSNAGLTIMGANNGNNMIAFGDAQDADRGFINYDHNADALVIQVAASEAMRIDSSGDVHIGTDTDAGGILNVSGSSDGDMVGLTVANTVSGGTNDTVSIELQLAGSSGQLSAASIVATKGEDWSSGTSRSGGMVLRARCDGTDTEFLRLGSGGDGVKQAYFSNDLGIGTAGAADTELHVKDTGSIEVRLEADSDNSGQEDCFIRFYTDGKTQEGLLGMDNNNSSTLFSGNTENAMVFGTVSNLPTIFATNNTERFHITSGGDISMGVTKKFSFSSDEDTYMSEYSANEFEIRTGGGRRFALSGGNAFFSGTVTPSHNFSDERLKENIVVIPNALEKVSSLRGITFTKKDDGSVGTGLIAQELEKVLPEAVYESKTIDTLENPDAEEWKAINYGNTVGLLVEAIKEQQTIIEDLKSRIETLEG